jgi:hypothetical protein
MQASESPHILLPPDAQPRTTTPTGLIITTLRDDPQSGAKTLILEAPPRAPGPSRPHFHASSEEIFNLGPPMTFDPGHPLPTHGYAFYPAHMPHGTAVSLPEGYRLFVRYTGNADVHFKDDAPFAPTPDHIHLPTPAPAPASNGLTLHTLSPSATLARLAPGAVLTLPPKASEFFLISGTLTTNKQTLEPETYLYSPHGHPPLTAQDEAMALIYLL